MVRIETDNVVCSVSFGNPGWRDTVRHAGAEARRLGATLHLVHVIAPTPWLMRRVMDEQALQAHEADQRAHAQRLLEEAAGAVPDGVNRQVHAPVGKPSVATLQVLESVNGGLLVIGCTRPNNARVVVGGVADRLLRLSPVPVLIAGPTPPSKPSTVLVPTGLGPGGVAAINVALDLVGNDGVVKALHMVALPGVMRAYSGDVLKLRASMEATARAELDQHLATTHAGPGTAALEGLLRTNLENVPADQTIIAEARAAQADLICLALGGRGLAPGLLIGRVSQRLMRSLPCPLLALPDAWIEARRAS